MILKNLVNCTQEQWQQILALRNENSIRANMYTDHVISWEEHLKWLERLASDKSNITFAVIQDDAAIGLASINNINITHKTADWAFYISPSAQGKGIGAVLEFTILDYAFHTLRLSKLNCQVLNFNESVIKMHSKFGFIKEGELRSQISKQQGRVNVVLLGILKQEWEQLREQKKYIIERFQEKVEVNS